MRKYAVIDKPKYITYRDATTGGSSHGYRGNTYRSDVHFRRYAPGQTNTDRQTDTVITILRSTTGGRVTSDSNINFLCMSSYCAEMVGAISSEGFLV